jgi:hypothetical protein
MTRPNIQIDEIGNVREMTDEEYAEYETLVADIPVITDVV